jgi:hypothetical protein
LCAYSTKALGNAGASLATLRAATTQIERYSTNPKKVKENKRKTINRLIFENWVHFLLVSFNPSIVCSYKSGGAKLGIKGTKFPRILSPRFRQNHGVGYKILAFLHRHIIP